MIFNAIFRGIAMRHKNILRVAEGCTEPPSKFIAEV